LRGAYRARRRTLRGDARAARRDLGLSESPLFSAGEKAAFDFAVAAAAVPNAVSPEIADALRRHWDEGEIVEILGVVALFGFLNRWNDSMATTLEPGAAQAGESRLERAGWSRGKHR
jgi:alkylhydroperoxidase family enzyme